MHTYMKYVFKMCQFAEMIYNFIYYIETNQTQSTGIFLENMRIFVDISKDPRIYLLNGKLRFTILSVMWTCFYLPISVDICICVNEGEVGELRVVIDWWDGAIVNVCVVINSCGVVTDVITDVVYLTSFDVIASVKAVWVVLGYWEVVGILTVVILDRVEGWEVIAFCVVVYSRVVMTSDADVMIGWLDVPSSSVVDWTSDDVGIWDVGISVVGFNVTSVTASVVDTTSTEKILVK